jgi:hypothetical protein
MITFGLLFWIIMLISLLFGGWQSRGPEGKWNYLYFGGSLILWILLALLGYKVFGPPLSG